MHVWLVITLVFTLFWLLGLVITLSALWFGSAASQAVLLVLWLLWVFSLASVQLLCTYLFWC
jgi:hypothetical protein